MALTPRKCLEVAPVTCSKLIPSVSSDWDPTKWIIWVLHRYTPFVPTIATTPEAEILKARAHVHRLHADRLTSQIPNSELAKDDWQLPEWTKADLVRELELDEGAVFLLIDGYIVDVGGYLDVHVSPAFFVNQPLLTFPCSPEDRRYCATGL